MFLQENGSDGSEDDDDEEDNWFFRKLKVMGFLQISWKASVNCSIVSWV